MQKIITSLLLAFMLVSATAQTTINHPASSPLEKTNGTPLYGCRVNNSGQAVFELVSFSSSSPGDVTVIESNFVAGSTSAEAGAFYNGHYYLYTYSGAFENTKFIKIAVNDWSIVSNISITSPEYFYMTDMAYDHATNTMYGAFLNLLTGGTPELYTINLETGAITLVATTTKSLYTLAVSPSGQMYGISDGGEFCSVNKTTGACTVISSLGTIAFSQSMTFKSSENKILWAMHGPNHNTGKLFEIDPTTGAATDLGVVGNNAQIVGLFSTIMPTEFSPADGDDEVALSATVTATFNQNITAGNLSAISFSPSVGNVSGSISGNVLSIGHAAFAYSTEYTVTIPKSAISNLAYDISWSFTTLPNPGECNAPSQLKAENIDYNSASLSWKENGSATSWNIKYGEKGFNVTTEGTLIGGLGATSHQLTGINDATDYDFYAQAICNDGELSAWSAVCSFRTPMDCDKGVTVFPWTEGFEGELFPPECWTAYDIDGNVANQEWVRNTNPSFVRTGMASASHNFDINHPQEGWLVTCKIVVPTGDDSHILRFWDHNLNPDDYVYNGVWISEGSADPADGDFVEVWHPTKVEKDWVEQKVNLSEFYAGKGIYIAFVYKGKGAPNGLISHRWSIDDLSIDTYSYKDLQVISLDNPSGGGANMPADMEIKVTLYNNGSAPLTNTPITLKINGETVAEEVISETISSLAYYQYAFKKRVDMSQPGSYTFEIEATLAGDQDLSNNKIEKSLLRIPDDYMTLYGFSIMRYPANDNTFISFSTEDVGAELTDLATYVDGNNIACAGEYLDGYFYMFTETEEHDNIHFIKIDTKTWTEVFKKDVAVGAREMTFDHATYTMYFVTPSTTGHSDLYTVNLKTGEQQLVAKLNRYFYGLACDLDGQMYGVSEGGDFCAIDKESGEIEVIGNTGHIYVKYLQSMAFDHNSGRLFWSLAGEGPNSGSLYGGFLEVDKKTGICYYYGRVFIHTEIIGLYTPYDRGLAPISCTPKGSSVALDAAVAVEFDQDISGQDLSKITITPNPGNVTASVEGDKVAITHDAFAKGIKYTVSIPAGAIADVEKDIVWSFTTIKDESIAGDENMDIQIYPNPSRGTVSLTVPENSTIKIFDLSGRMVETHKKSGEVVLNLSLENGIYIVQIESAGNTISRKLIINK